MTVIILPGSTESQRRRAIGALHDPHSAKERMDPEFLVLTRCSRCGKYDQIARKFVSAAIHAHVTEDCPGRHSAADEPIVVRVFYPKQ